MQADYEHFREHAAWTRDLAECSTDDEVKRHLLEVADQYDRIADEVGGRVAA